MAVALTKTPLYNDELGWRMNFYLFWALIAAAVLLLAEGGVIVAQALAPKPPPYVFAVEHGQIKAAAVPVLGMVAINDQIVMWAIGEYIEDCFSVSHDYPEEMERLGRASMMETKEVGKIRDAWYHKGKGENDPMKIGPTGWRQIKVGRKLADAGNPGLYQVDYKTTTYVINQPQRSQPAEINWRATLRIKLGPPSDVNPLGITVTALSFGQEQQ